MAWGPAPVVPGVLSTNYTIHVLDCDSDWHRIGRLGRCGDLLIGAKAVVRSIIEQTHGAPCDARVDADARDADVDAPIRVQRRHGAAYEAKP